MSEADEDPVVRELRQQIATNDLVLLEALNRRLELVRELKRHKDSHGLEFVDPEQERRLLDRLAEANHGPLSEEAVREIYGILLELTKREV
jgi:chorismate mutase